MFTKRFLLDLLERSVSTFLQAFAGTLITDGIITRVDLSLRDKLILAATAGGLAVLKALVATQVGAKDSAALLPAEVDPPSEAARAEALRGD